MGSTLENSVVQMTWLSSIILSSARTPKYFWHSASFPAKYCHGCHVFPWSTDRSNAHTPGLGELFIVTTTYATWNNCCKSMSNVTRLYFSPREMAGDCHHVLELPSTTLVTGWAFEASASNEVQ